MARVLWLPEVLRDAGLVCHEEPGWKTRGGDTFSPVAAVCHGTGGAIDSTDRAEINWICYNSPIRPVSQLYLSRSGEWWALASGNCNHIGDACLSGTGRCGNPYAIGIEAQHTSGEPWTDRQYNSYVTGVAAICRHTGWPASRVFGHYEISSTGKTDPYFDMDPFRVRVAAAMEGDDVSAYDVWHTERIKWAKNTPAEEAISPAEFLQRMANATAAHETADAARDAQVREAMLQALRDEVPALAESLAGLTGEEIGSALGEWLAARLGSSGAA